MFDTDTVDGRPGCIRPLCVCAFQIYCDFSGVLRHRARLAKLLGFELAAELQPRRTRQRTSRSSGGAGTSRCRRGSATTSTSRSAAIAAARVAHLPQLDADDAARRPVARRELELRIVGCGCTAVIAIVVAPWRRWWRAAVLTKLQHYSGAAALVVRVLSHITCVGWLLFAVKRGWWTCRILLQ